MRWLLSGLGMMVLLVGCSSGNIDSLDAAQEDSQVADEPGNQDSQDLDEPGQENSQIHDETAQDAGNDGSDESEKSDGADCTPITCDTVGATCGSVDDLCGSTLTCGSCTDLEQCQRNQCSCRFTKCNNTCCASGQVCHLDVCCTPNCEGQACELDGCGQYCACSPPTLDDFWNSTSFFDYQTKFTFPTEGGGPYTLLTMNMGTSVVVRGDTWYIFTREYLLNKPAYCPADVAHVVARRSLDRGHTWTDYTPIIEPYENGPYECAALDGHAFYDAEADTWHYVFQGLPRNGVWNISHASRVGADPLGPFTTDPGNPVIHSADLWHQICNSPGDHCYDLSGGSNVHDEGTPEIIEKRDGLFYVSFHGYDGVRGYRGVARTLDFHTWELINSDAIFDRYDCQPWNVPWDAGGCIAGGLATVLQQGSQYYMLIEAADKNLGCTEDQNWILGLMRSPSLEATQWNSLPGNQSAVVFSSRELKPNGHTVQCNVQYHRLFKDNQGSTYLLFGRLGALFDTDSVTGIYLYKLKPELPFVAYRFREGPSHQFTNSDIVSRGNFEAQLFNTTWQGGGADGSYLLDFNGSNSYVQMPSNPLFDITTNVQISLRLLIHSLPSAHSALIAGKLGSYWIEIYEGGNLCFWINNPSGMHNVCTPISLNQWHSYIASYQGSSLSLMQDGVQVASADAAGTGLVPSGILFRLGSAGPDANGYYASFDGQVDELDVRSLP